jgi:Protein of unknown function (DUF2281)
LYMSEQVFLKQYNQLPEALKQELLDFFEFLMLKYKAQGGQKKVEKQPTPSKSTPKAGFLKGTFVLSPDFDEPLEDFKEYMA